MKIISVVGARPNFMKIAPFIKAIKAYNHSYGEIQPSISADELLLGEGTQIKQDRIQHLLVHTGQHYDLRMSEAFFKALDIPDPDINLEIGSGTHALQVGNTMIAFEKVLLQEKPDWVVVLGDVNATLACSVTAKKLNIRVCHIEAGLRSGDLSMPEEINRLVTDRLSDLLLTPDLLSVENLKAEGVSKDKIRNVGNIMIDTLETNREKAASLSLKSIFDENTIEDCSCKTQIPEDGTYTLMTLHRPSNVDKKEVLKPLIDFLLSEISPKNPLIWPVHPRTKKQLIHFGLWSELTNSPGVFLLEPLGYHEMLRLNMGARIMLTDSGGLQEECCVLGTPCLTLRWNTERPITLIENEGICVLVGNQIELIKNEFKNAILRPRISTRPNLWDGKTAERCVNEILNYVDKTGSNPMFETLS